MDRLILSENEKRWTMWFFFLVNPLLLLLLYFLSGLHMVHWKYATLPEDTWDRGPGTSRRAGKRVRDRGVEDWGEEQPSSQFAYAAHPPLQTLHRELYAHFTLIPHYGDLPGGPVAKTPCSQCSRFGFNPWLGN